MAGANGHFALSLAGRPCYNRCDQLVDDLLSKGELLEGELQPSTPLGAHLVHTANQRKKLLAEVQNDLEELQPTSNPELLLVCARGKLDSLQTILASPMNLDTLSPTTHYPEGVTPLSAAIIAHQAPVSSQLLKSGAQVNRVDPKGTTALHWAVLTENSGIVKLLLANGAKPDKLDAEGLSPLHYSCVSGLQQLVALLIKENASGIDVHSVLLACLCGHPQLVKTLLKRAPQLALEADGCGMSAMHYATWSGDVKCLKAVCSHIAGSWRQAVVQRDKWGRTPLIIAAAKGDPVMCQLLLKKGATLREVDGEGRGVMHWAVLSQQVSCVKFLLQCKGGVLLCSLQDNAGACPLHYAAMQKDPAILTALLSHDPCSASVSTHRDMGALSWAALCNCLEVVEILLKTLRGEEEEEEEGAGPLHVAACVGAVRMCEVLLGAQAKVTDFWEGSTPLHYASRYGHTHCVKCLLEHGAVRVVDSTSESHQTGLHLAVIHGHTETVRVLLEHGANRDMPMPPTESQPLHLACCHGHSEALQVIIQAGGSVNQPRASDDHTPLYIATSLGHLDCCKVLIENGADMKTRIKSTTEGLTALDISMANGHSGCTSYLMACHAPSGGGVYHRAAVTIQAVWRYYRHKCRRATAHYWSAVVLQRCVRRWLCGVRAKRVKQARLAARHRAARTIQSRWRDYIREKRRYEATCARLKARLQQEQVAASLIIAELQSQMQSVSLPLPETNTRQRRSQHLLKISASQRSVFTEEGRLAASRPRKALASQSPAIKLQPHSKRDPDHSKANSQLLPSISSPHHHSHTPTPLLTSPTTTGTSLPHLHHVTHVNTSGKPNIKTKVEKLPPIPAVNSITVQQPQVTQDEIDSHPQPVNESELHPMGVASPLELRPHLQVTRTPPGTPILGTDDGGGIPCPASPPSFKIPSRPQQKLTRRFSAFKATPLGYRTYPLRDRKNSDKSSAEDDLREFKLESPEEPFTAPSLVEEFTKVSFSETLEMDISDSGALRTTSTPSENSVDGQKRDSRERPSSRNEDIIAQNETSVSVEHRDEGGEKGQEKLLNQVERFERLMKVLTLLKDNANMSEFERQGGEEGGGERGKEAGTMEELRDCIKLALDEAVQLRVETTGLNPTTVSTSE